MSVPDDPRNKETGPTPRRARVAGLALMAVAVFLPLSGGQKVRTTPALLVGGESFLWISVVPGRELFRRYRAHLDPRRLLGRRAF